MEFLDEDNIAGTSLLQLVARGSSILTEIERLSKHIPIAFTDPKEIQKYSLILMDFKYLKATEAYDEKIDRDADAIDLDEEFRENHMELLHRFYTLFESLYKYIENLNSYLADMNEGKFLLHTVDGVLNDTQGKQLMTEAFYLYGCMLLLLDIHIPGPIRERIIIAYYRYKGASVLIHIDEVVNLCRDTGFVYGSKRPANYPEDFFARVPVNSDVIDMVIGKLRSDDIYNHLSSFPLPAHHSMALAQQAAMLYVIIYFQPDILKNQVATCREIIDKFYVDNWMIEMYMGHIIDITEEWDPYKAAKNTMKENIKSDIQKLCVNKHEQLCKSLNTELDHLLTQGVLTDEYLLDNQRNIMNHTRACNVTIKWLLIHRTTKNAKLHDYIKKAVPNEQILRLLMNTAQFEFVVKNTITRLLGTKNDKWCLVRDEAGEMIDELADMFGGGKALKKVKKNEKLQKWFAQIADQIRQVNLSSGVIAGRTLSQLISALQGVEGNHHVEGSLQAMQYISDVKDMLGNMVKLANITQKMISDLDIICDLTYAKIIIKEYTPLLHRNIARDPSTCLLLRATFLKLSSILSTPLVRIIQSSSDDDISVAEFYSTELVNYVRSVLEIVPISVFEILGKISVLTSTKIKTLPAKMERKYLKESAKMVDRYSLAKMTYNISVFTKGILNMHTTLLGIIKLDPQQTLEIGVRRELIRVVCQTFHDNLVFTSGKLNDFENKLKLVGEKLTSIRCSLEYIQDYINSYGLKMWQEELCRVLNYNVEQERNLFLKKKVYDYQSNYQSDEIRIPIMPRLTSSYNDQDKFVNFTGRVMNELLKHSHPMTHTYSPLQQCWLHGYDSYYSNSSSGLVGSGSSGNGTLTIGPSTFTLLRQSLTIFGLCGIDKLMAFKIVSQFTTFMKQYKALFSPNNSNNININEILFLANQELHPTSQFPHNGMKVYTTCLTKLSKPLDQLMRTIVEIGHMVLLRSHMTRELRYTAQTESHILTAGITNLNNAVLNDLEAHYNNNNVYNYPENPLMPEITKWLDTMGMVDPVSKIYITTDPLPHSSLLLFLTTLHAVSKLKWDPKLNTLVNNDKKVCLDGAAFVIGLSSLLKQLHSTHTHTWLNYLGQYVKTSVGGGTKSGDGVIPPLTQTLVLFTHEYCRHTNINRDTIEAVIPTYILDASM